MLPLVESFLAEQGCMKFVRPLYRALSESPRCAGGREAALRAFSANAPRYHPVTRKMCAVDLKLEAAAGDGKGDAQEVA